MICDSPSFLPSLLLPPCPRSPPLLLPKGFCCASFPAALLLLLLLLGSVYGGSCSDFPRNITTMFPPPGGQATAHRALFTTVLSSGLSDNAGEEARLFLPFSPRKKEKLQGKRVLAPSPNQKVKPRSSKLASCPLAQSTHLPAGWPTTRSQL